MLSWTKIGMSAPSTTITDARLKTCHEIMIQSSYGELVTIAPREVFSSECGVGVAITLYANSQWYTNYSRIFLDESTGTLSTEFVCGLEYTNPISFLAVYIR